MNDYSWGWCSLRIRWAVQQNFFFFYHYGSFILYPRPLLSSLSARLLIFPLPHIQSMFSLSLLPLHLFPPPLPSRSLSFLSVFLSISGTSSVWGGFLIGVNGLGRMKHCVPLSEIAICFVWDQWGDPGLVPAGDDGIMSHRKTIRKRRWGKHITSQHQLCLNFTFSWAKYLHPLCLKRALNFYDTFMSGWSKTTADVNLVS